MTSSITRTFNAKLRYWNTEPFEDDINHCLADMRDELGLDCKIQFSALIHSIKAHNLESRSFPKHINRLSISKKIVEDLSRRDESFYVSFTVHATKAVPRLDLSSDTDIF